MRPLTLAALVIAAGSAFAPHAPSSRDEPKYSCDRAYRRLSQPEPLSIARATEDPASLAGAGYVVAGVLADGRFRAGSAITGKGKGHAAGSACPSPMSPGWVELNTGTMHGDQEAISPMPPYVHGCIGPAAGTFITDEPAKVETMRR